MSPLAVEMLVWFATRVEPYPDMHSAQREVVAHFYLRGIVDRNDAFATATAKGRAWLSLICATPMPEQQWVDPRTGVKVE
jgi:hypothetical protein